MSTLTINQAARAFGVSTMTLWLWRAGTPTKEATPHNVEQVGKANRITYPVGKLKAWAKKHGLEFKVDPDEVLRQPAAKSGPVKKSAKKAVPSKRGKVRH